MPESIHKFVLMYLNCNFLKSISLLYLGNWRARMPHWSFSVHNLHLLVHWIVLFCSMYSCSLDSLKWTHLTFLLPLLCRQNVQFGTFEVSDTTICTHDVILSDKYYHHFKECVSDYLCESFSMLFHILLLRFL